MHEVNLASLDLNLLVALQALLEERNVTRAAEKVGLSQPAMSRALGRLRKLFNDPLLVRTSSGMVLTVRAEQTVEPLRRAMIEVRRVIANPTFEPATARGVFRISAWDYETATIVPLIVTRLAKEAPNLEILMITQNNWSLEKLEQNTVELTLGAFANIPSGFYRQRIMTDKFVSVVRAGHPLLKGKLTPERFVEFSHIVTSVSGEGPGPVDKALENFGLKRHIALRVPNFLTAPLCVATTDLVVTMPYRLAQQLEGLANLKLIEPPIQLMGIRVSQVWHERHHYDPAHTWFRNLVQEEALKANLQHQP
jgi:DNA-binding transcriptional LysR family regulator